jgi:uncharacterized protein (TIGR03067 family)
MLRITGVAGVLLGLVLVAQAQQQPERQQQPGQPPAGQQDTAKLQGTWTVVSAEKDGKQETADSVKDKQVRITSNTMTCVDKSGKTEMAAQYRVNTSTKPWQIEMTVTEGEHKGKKMKGIVELSGDTLRICHAEPDKEAPREFKAKEDQCSLTLRRSAQRPGQ